MTQVVCDLFQHLKLISLASLIFQGLIFNPWDFLLLQLKVANQQTNGSLTEARQGVSEQTASRAQRPLHVSWGTIGADVAAAWRNKTGQRGVVWEVYQCQRAIQVRIWTETQMWTRWH